jgi:ribonuclease Z
MLSKPLNRRGWIAVGIAATASAAAVLAFVPDVQQWLFDRGAEKMTATDSSALLADDAMRVLVCGTSAPLPSASRAKACIAVFAGGKFYVVDTGPESVENLMLGGIPMSAIGGVMLTHFHSDHIGDLGELQLQTWAGGRQQPLPVYGGPGVEQVVDGFNRAYAQDQVYRTEHHGETVMPSAAWGMTPKPVLLDGAPTPLKDRTRVFLDDGSLRVTAIEVDHSPIEPAYAYRFDYKGRSIVVSGDYKRHEPLARAAAGADILFSEALSREMTTSLERAAKKAERPGTAAIMHDIQDYHVSPEEAAELANQAGVRELVYYHLAPAPDNPLMQRLFSQGVNPVRPDHWSIADDGNLYTLPLGSRTIEFGRLE